MSCRWRTAGIPSLAHLSLPSKLFPRCRYSVLNHMCYSRNNEDWGTQRNTPRRVLIIGQDIDLAEVDTENGDERTDLDKCPEAPVEMHQVFAVAELYRKPGEGLKNDGYQSEQRADGCDGYTFDLHSSLRSSLGFDFGDSFDG